MPEPKRLLKAFLCHASQDKPIVRELYQRLKTEGWIDTWFDEKKLLPGQDWRLNIEEAVETSDIVIICLSSNSVSKEGFVQKELRYARELSLEKLEESIFLIPLRIDECDVPRGLRFYQWADYFGEKKDETYNSLLESLRLRYEQKLKIEKEEHARKEKEKLERKAAKKTAREKQEREATEKAARENASRQARTDIDNSISYGQNKFAEGKSYEQFEECKREVVSFSYYIGGIVPSDLNDRYILELEGKLYELYQFAQSIQSEEEDVILRALNIAASLSHIVKRSENRIKTGFYKNVIELGKLLILLGDGEIETTENSRIENLEQFEEYKREVLSFSYYIGRTVPSDLNDRYILELEGKLYKLHQFAYSIQSEEEDVILEALSIAANLSHISKCSLDRNETGFFKYSIELGKILNMLNKSSS